MSYQTLFNIFSRIQPLWLARKIIDKKTLNINKIKSPRVICLIQDTNLKLSVCENLEIFYDDIGTAIEDSPVPSYVTLFQGQLPATTKKCLQ